jgi:hypothetical protein
MFLRRQERSARRSWVKSRILKICKEKRFVSEEDL